MDCQKCKKYLSDYIADELDSEESQRVSLHLDQCPECQRRYKFEKTFLTMFKSKVYRETAPSYLKEKILQGIGKDQAKAGLLERFYSSLFGKPLLIPTFATVLILICGLLLFSTLFRGKLPSLVISLVQAHVTNLTAGGGLSVYSSNVA